MNFPMTVRFFDSNRQKPLIPRTAIVTGEGEIEGTVHLEVFSRIHEDQRVRGDSVTQTVRNVPFYKAVPAKCEQAGPRNSRFFPDGPGEVVPMFCCERFDDKLAVPDLNPPKPAEKPAKQPA